MKQKKLLFVGIILCALIFSGCSTKKEELNTSETSKETTTVTSATSVPESHTLSSTEVTTVETDNIDIVNAEETDLFSYPSEDPESILYDSFLGYSCMYDPTVFVLDDTGDGDYFSYQTAESLAAPIYMSVQVYSDMNAETLADGLVLQSGLDDVEVQDTYFGANSIMTKSVYIEQEINGINQIQIFYAIPAGTGSLLVELGGYVGMPETAEHKLQEITGTFSYID